MDVYAQGITIKGSVLSGGEAVPYAAVKIMGLGQGKICDGEGMFSFTNIKPGNYTVETSAIGYLKSLTQIQVSTTNEYLKIHLKKDPKLVNEVVITGTMKEMSRSESPVPVEIYSSAFFQKNPTPSLFDALQIVNGVRPQLNCNICNTGDIHINGMEGPYTAILIDGMPIVSSLSSVYGLSGIPNSMVERIEIVKGPASTLYGSEAVGGLINVITKDPLKAPRLTVDLSTGTYQDLNVDAAAKWNLGNKWNALFSANYYRFDKIWDINKDNFTDITLQDRVSVFNKWDVTRKEGRAASFALRYVYEDRWGGELDWTPEFRGGDSIYGESIYTERIEWIGKYQLPTKEKLTLQTSWNYHYQNSFYGTTSYNALQRISFAQLVYDKRINMRNDFLAGLAMRHTFYDDNTPGTASADTNNFINKPESVYMPGLFIQNEYSINEFNRLLVAARLDLHSEHGPIITPRLNYKWNDAQSKHIVRLSAGSGFRVVNLFTEDHAALTGAREVEIKSDLKPEQSWNMNLNLQKFIFLRKGFISTDLSVFYTYFTNRINGDFETDPGKIIYDNLNGYAVSKGVSLNVDWNFEIPLKVSAGITLMDVYQQNKDSLGNYKRMEQLYASDFSGNFIITYRLEKAKISIDYTGNVYGPMPLPVVPNDFRPAYSKLYSIQNIQITRKFKFGMELYTGIKNILNFIPDNPILRPFDPFDKTVHIDNPNGYMFDPGYMYAPIQGIRGFVGLRYVLH